MRKLRLAAIATAAVLIGALAAQAQVTSSGTMGVTASVQASISLVISQATGGVALTGTWPNTSLGFGTVTAYASTCGTTPVVTNGVTCTVDSNNMKISTPIHVTVLKAHTGSSNYTLKAKLNEAPAGSIKWKVGASADLGTDDTNVTTSGSYGAAGVDQTVEITVPLSTDLASNGSIGKTITFTAVAN